MMHRSQDRYRQKSLRIARASLEVLWIAFAETLPESKKRLSKGKSRPGIRSGLAGRATNYNVRAKIV
jgi:hypothetical protein